MVPTARSSSVGGSECFECLPAVLVFQGLLGGPSAELGNCLVGPVLCSVLWNSFQDEDSFEFGVCVG